MDEFRELVGKDIIVDYPFCGEMQKWSLKNFYIDENGNIKHKRIDDLKHNSNLSRLNKITDKDMERYEKYQKAIQILSGD